IGTTHAKGTDSRPADSIRLPVPKLPVYIKGAVFKIYVWVWLIKSQRGRDLLVVQAQYRFDKSRHSCGGRQVPQVAFYGTQGTVLFLELGAKSQAQPFYFNGISQRGACSMCFYVSDGGRIYLRIVKGHVYCPRLSRGTRG